MIIEKMFQIAKRKALKGPTGREYYLGAVGIRSDGTIVSSSNGLVMMIQDDYKKSYPPGHAEYRLAMKLDKGAIVFVCRVKKNNGEFSNARPCRDCQRKLISRGVKRVYYTVSENEYGVMEL